MKKYTHLYLKGAFLLLCACAWHVPIWGQSKATKEETIKWISDKINRYGLRVDESDNKDNAYAYLRVTGDKRHPVLVDRIEYSRDYEEDYVHLDEVDIVDTVYDATNHIPYGLNVHARTAEISTIPNMHFGSVILRLNWKAEPDLYNRMYKAFKALATFNYGGDSHEAY